MGKGERRGASSSGPEGADELRELREYACALEEALFCGCDPSCRPAMAMVVGALRRKFAPGIAESLPDLGPLAREGRRGRWAR